MASSVADSSAAARRARTGRVALALVAAALVLALPWWASDYWTRIATGVLMWAGLAASWNIVGGYAGYINFGHSAFFGIGAYSTGILMTGPLELPFITTLPVGFVVAGAVAVAMGIPTLRLRGAYFAIATWAFAEAMLQAVNIVDVTGGAAGLSLPPLLNTPLFYYTMLAAAVLTYAACWVLLERSRLGYRLKALRDNETAAQAMGINTTAAKVQAFALSAAIAAVFGGIYAYWITFIDPISTMGGDITDQMVVMVLLGGLGHPWGPAIGATTLYLVNRLVWSIWGDTAAYIAILGLAIVGVVLFLPDGLVSLWPRFQRRAMAWKLLGRLFR